MEKQDYIYTDKNGYKIRILSLIPNEPKRLLLIPPLVGATGVLAIRTFRYFFRESCLLMSFDYCGHYDEIDNKFTVKGTFTDTEVSLVHAIECAKKMKIPMHVVGACYGLIPLLFVLNKMQWPRQEIRSMFSVSGLVSMTDLLNFDDYKRYLDKRGLLFKNKSEFVDFIVTNKKEFVKNKQIYIETFTEYLLEIFAELSDIISRESFGILKYSKAKFYESFYEFMTISLPKIVIPAYFPCLFFSGDYDRIFGLEAEKGKTEYLKKVMKIAPHAKNCNIRIDHFGRGEDHYVIGKEGMKFLIENEK